MNKRIRYLSFLTVFIFSIIISNLFYIMLVKNKYYNKSLKEMTNILVNGSTAPRGRIFDVKKRLLVGNTSKLVISYKKLKDMSLKDELLVIKKLAILLKIDYQKLNNTDLNYYLKLTNKSLNEKTKLEAYLYFLMHNGYAYDYKTIKENNVLDEEIAYIMENLADFKGVNIINKYERIYPYSDTFKKILGSVGAIPSEELEKYLKKGYDIYDTVGISYLEKQYDSYLKGKNALYKKINNSTLELVREAINGNDLVLTIDIELQKEVDEIIKEEILKTKNEPNTYYFDKANIVLLSPKTGAILAMSGKSLINNTFYDYTEGIFLNPMTVGSVVKGASMLVGYNNNGIEIGEVKLDECLKIAATPKKCSHITLGNINDLEALALSSNVYQFKGAIKVGGGHYRFNEPLKLKADTIDIYRNTFKEFGLGLKTEIDLPKESVGYTSKSTLSGHVLDFVMGQFDTYTPIQLAQYINTFASDKKRIAPTLLKSVLKSNDKIYENNAKILNVVNTKDIYFNRVLEGLKYTATSNIGLARGYIYNNIGSGKTGTSQSFIDTNQDNIIDKETISTAFVGYFPSDDPKISIAITAPNVSFLSNYYYISEITKRISNKVTTLLINKYL